MASKQLCKIKSEAKISGVCAGLSHYFDIDVTLIRLIWVALALFGVGSPIIVYIIFAVVLPECDTKVTYYDDRYDDDDYGDDDRYNY